MKKIVTILFLLTLVLPLMAQQPEIVTIKGESLIEWREDLEAKNDVKKTAQEQAIVNALETAFGTLVVQGNSIFLENKRTGQKTETFSKFNMIGNTYVKGEVLNVVSVEFNDIETKEGKGRKKTVRKLVQCKVVIEAKEVKESSVELQTWTCVCPDKNCRREAFKEGEDLFLYFKSPISGYITVYLDDTKNTSRLLPYQEVSTAYENGLPVEADKDYVFFSANAEHNYYQEETTVDEYQLYAESEKDLNRVFVIFSKTPINKPELKTDINKAVLEELSQQGFSSPKELPSEKFQEWLLKNRYIRDDIQVEVFDISVEK